MLAKIQTVALACVIQFPRRVLPGFSESDGLARKANQAEYSARMHRALLEYIDRHLDQELDLRALARVAILRLPLKVGTGQRRGSLTGPKTLLNETI